MSTESNEQWMTIKGYEDYQVNRFGVIKSIKFGKELILKPIKTIHGYLRVGLSKNGKCKLLSVHRIVAEAFLPNPNNLPQVNHKDEDKTNNCVENLEWVDNSQNIRYGSGIERRAKLRKKNVLQYSLDGELVNEWDSATDIQNNLGLPKQNISKCCMGERHSCGGFVWKFKTE